MTITEFLEARLSEDEARALLAREWIADGPSPHIPWFGAPGDNAVKVLGGAGPHIARHDPARVLAECAAKRKIIDGVLELERDGLTLLTDPWASATYKHSMHWFIRPFAAVYASHPDYEQGWAL